MPFFKCHFCPVCKGTGCIGEMPGMGGPNESVNFIRNCKDWSLIPEGPFTDSAFPEIRLAPVTGAVENIGFDSEEPYYSMMMSSCASCGVKLSIGDGTPDCKLKAGIQAVAELGKSVPGAKAAVFIKPYPDEKILERSLWADGIAELYGIDIDSYNIVTMRNLVHLEKKTASQLKELKSYFNHRGFPFAIKGVFTEHDTELVKEVKPDICYISNHGGRVDTVTGSTAEFLMKNAETLRANSGRLWVDGGIRSANDARKAASYGCDTVLLGRPLITSLCRDTQNGSAEFTKSMKG